MTESEIETYIKEASPNLSRSIHGIVKGGPDQKSFGTSYLRTSKQSWIKEDQIPTEYSAMVDNNEALKVPLATKVSRRIQNATLMNVFTLNGGEAFQVANYGIAGQYTPHYDAAPGLNENSGSSNIVNSNSVIYFLLPKYLILL